MIHIERSAGGVGEAGAGGAGWFRWLVHAQLATFVLYAVYFPLRWLHRSGAVPATWWPFVHHFRNGILVFIAAYTIGAMLASRRARAPGATGILLSRRAKAIILVVLAYTAVAGVLNVLLYNGLGPIIDVRDLSMVMLGTPWIVATIDIMVQVDAVLVSFMLVILVPRLAGTYQRQFAIARVYVLGRRIHESTAGLGWILIGIMLILTSDEFDRLVGILFLILGAYLIGRDNDDVRDMSFITDAFRPAGGDRLAGPGGP